MLVMILDDLALLMLVLVEGTDGALRKCLAWLAVATGPAGGMLAAELRQDALGRVLTLVQLTCLACYGLCVLLGLDGEEG